MVDRPIQMNYNPEFLGWTQSERTKSVRHTFSEMKPRLIKEGKSKLKLNGYSFEVPCTVRINL